VVCRDIVADGVPGGPYDLIHTRMLLMHLPARDKLLKELVSALRPGGWLLAEELDSFPVTQLADGLYGTTTRQEPPLKAYARG
jgi:SAM-dependent methyltransferase